MSGEMPDAAPDPWPELRARWEAHETAQIEATVNDPMVQTLAGILPHCTGAVTPGVLIDRLGDYVGQNYPDVPPNRYSDVSMNAADILLQREAEANGEA